MKNRTSIYTSQNLLIQTKITTKKHSNMTGKEQSKLDGDDYTFEPPLAVAEAIRSGTRSNETTALPPSASPSSSSTTSDATNQEELYDGPRIDIAAQVPDDQKHLVGPAGVGGAVVGFVFGGPLLSAFLGFGSAYAVRKENGAGDAARALGEVTMSVQKKAAEIEDRHRYYERSVNAINSKCEKSKESVAYKTKQLVVNTWTTLEKCTKRKQLIERSVEGTGRGVEYVASVVTGSKKKKNTDRSEEESELLFQEANEKAIPVHQRVSSGCK